MRRDSSATSAEAALSRRRRIARRAGTAQPLAWFGIYERSYVFDHDYRKVRRRRAAGAGAIPRPVARFAESAADRAPEPEIAAEFALTEAEYAQRIAQFTSGFAPEMCIS